jgi:hypothetical protein
MTPVRKASAAKAVAHDGGMDRPPRVALLRTPEPTRDRRVVRPLFDFRLTRALINDFSLPTPSSRHYTAPLPPLGQDPILVVFLRGGGHLTPRALNSGCACRRLC